MSVRYLEIYWPPIARKCTNWFHLFCFLQSATKRWFQLRNEPQTRSWGKQLLRKPKERAWDPSNSHPSLLTQVWHYLPQLSWVRSAAVCKMPQKYGPGLQPGQQLPLFRLWALEQIFWSSLLQKEEWPPTTYNRSLRDQHRPVWTWLCWRHQISVFKVNKLSLKALAVTLALHYHSLNATLAGCWITTASVD